MRRWRWLTGLAAVIATALSAAGFPPSVVAAEIPPEQIELLENALPEQPAVVPKQPRKLLIFSLCKGYRHGVIPFASEALKRLGEKTGAYEAEISEDVSMFTMENLAAFDAIVFNNSTGTLFDDPQLKQNLLEFVKGGKGVVGVHAAIDCFYEWPEYGELLGGYFDGHPWHEPVTLRIEDPTHPICAAFDGTSFVVKDEIYQVRDPYSRRALRVLVRLDTSGTDMLKSGIHRADGDFAVSWVRSYGKGRMFYCSLGHRHGVFYNPTLLRYYLNGIQFALGDLEADATPSAEWARQTGGSAVMDDAFAEAAAYEVGNSRFALSVIAEEVRLALDDASKREAISGRLWGLLRSTEATDGGKAFACRQLALIGDDAAVPALAALLADEELSHMARYALERIPGKAAGDALREAVAALDGDLRIGVLNSLTARAEPQTADFLMTLDLGDEEPDVATVGALMAALLASADHERMAWLSQGVVSDEVINDPERGAAVVGPLLRYAERLVAGGRTGIAARTYQGLYNTAKDDHIRAAGLIGWARTSPESCIDTLFEHLAGEDPVWRGTAARLLAEIGGDEVTAAIAQRLSGQPPAAQVLMVEALARRGGPAANEAVIAAVDSADEQVSLAAIRALGDLGQASSVSPLAALAAGGNEEARESLDRLRGAGIDGTMAELMMRGPAAVRAELARSLGARRAASQVNALLRTASDDVVADVRLAALESLGELAGAVHLYQMVQLAVHAMSNEERVKAAASLVAVCRRVDDRDRRAQPVTKALLNAPAPAQAALLGVLGQLGGERALRAVRASLRSGEPDVSAAALAALAEWPDAAAADDLMWVAQHSSDPARWQIAFDGYVRAAGLPADRKPGETAAMYEKAMGIARGDDDVRLVLAGLAGGAEVESMRVAERYLANDMLRADAARAVLAVAENLDEEHRADALAGIDTVLHACRDDEAMRAEAGEVVNRVEEDEGFITAWEFAGPYTQDDLGGQELFDVAFPPEKRGEDAEAVEWRELPDAAFAEPGTFDLNAIESGSDCCGYVITEIVSERPQEARLELGSDDGLKVWFNGEVAHEANEMRGLTIGEGQCTVSLREGVNTLLLKITQGGGGWQVCCRIRAVDGFGLEGVEIRAPQ